MKLLAAMLMTFIPLHATEAVAKITPDLLRSVTEQLLIDEIAIEDIDPATFDIESDGAKPKKKDDDIEFILKARR